jgi:uncharacterized protein
LIVQALAISILSLDTSHAASFNCTPYIQRQACPEMLICSEAGLSRLDEVMASLYFTARGRMPASMLTNFRDYQREWLAKRDACGCDYKCLDAEYRAQINALRKSIQETGR